MIKILKPLFIIFSLSILSGCGTLEAKLSLPKIAGFTKVNEFNTDLHLRSVHIFNPVNLGERVSSLHLNEKVEEVIFLVDLRKKSFDSYRGVPIDIQSLELIRRFYETLPVSSDVQVKVGTVRTETKNFDEIHDVSGSSLSDTQILFTSSISNSLDKAVDRLSNEFVNGSTAVVLIAGWDSFDKKVEEAVLRMNQKSRFSNGTHISSNRKGWNGFKDQVCFFAIGLDNSMSRSKLTNSESCGFSVAGDKIMQAQDMAFFVEKVIYTDPQDTDNDGVFDYVDQCPNTLKGVLIDYSGCPKFVQGIQGDIR